MVLLLLACAAPDSSEGEQDSGAKRSATEAESVVKHLSETADLCANLRISRSEDSVVGTSAGRSSRSLSTVVYEGFGLVFP